jgi:uncharacterized protein YabN with tetrapyrrole methylase and pyrophosphatase domain
MPERGHLVVVGTGIAPDQVTGESRAWIEKADRVLYVVYDTATEALICRLNPRAESLATHYAEGKSRAATYTEMVDRILAEVHAGHTVCAAFYGHPGIFVYPSHAAIRRARREGYDAVMLPAVSSLDCLFADLGLDPAHGCQMLDASDVVLCERPLDTSCAVILWMVGLFGVATFREGGDVTRLPILVAYLRRFYDADHEVIVYQAAAGDDVPAVVERVRLEDLPKVAVPFGATLCIPPRGRPSFIPARARELGIPQEELDASANLDW